MTTLADLPTPALLVDLDKLDANIERMQTRCDRLGVALRPHVKTHKCVEIARRQRDAGAQGITVSTLAEARAFAIGDGDDGFDDITWAFPVVPSRLPEAVELARKITLRLTLDSPEAVAWVATAAKEAGLRFHVLLEVDSGDGRSGVDPESEAALNLAFLIERSPHLVFDGLLTHAGQSYAARSTDAAARVAGEERDAVRFFAGRLRSHQIEVPTVSVGSTPGMTAADDLEGVTEARPGNYAYFDATQVAIGSCAVADCAATVLATVVSSQPGADHSVVDAGALALSKDTGPGGDFEGMGRVYSDCAAGELEPQLRLRSLSQEHGVLSERRPMGERVRILPNHSCLAAACFDRVHAVRGDEVVDVWTVHRGR